MKLIGNDGIIDYSKVYIENSRVSVKFGPLLGMEGAIKRIDKRKGRATIILNFLGEPRLVDVGIEILEKLE